MAILPLLFPGKYNDDTLIEHYRSDNCNLNLYLDTSNPTVQQIDFRPSNLWVYEKMRMTFGNHLWHGRAIVAKRWPTINSMGWNQLLLAPYKLGKFKDINDKIFTPRNHYANFLNNITFISFDVDCGFAEFPNDVIHSNENDFVKLQIPSELFNSPNALKADKAVNDFFYY